MTGRTIDRDRTVMGEGGDTCPWAGDSGEEVRGDEGYMLYASGSKANGRSFWCW